MQPDDRNDRARSSDRTHAPAIGLQSSGRAGGFGELQGWRGPGAPAEQVQGCALELNGSRGPFTLDPANSLSAW